MIFLANHGLGNVLVCSIRGWGWAGEGGGWDWGGIVEVISGRCRTGNAVGRRRGNELAVASYLLQLTPKQSKCWPADLVVVLLLSLRCCQRFIKRIISLVW